MRNTTHRFATLLTLVCSLALAAPALAAPAKATNLCNASTANLVVSATNDYRASLGLPRLHVVSKLTVFATTHVRDMATSNVLTHSSSTGLSFAARAHGSNYRFTTMRENVAVEGAPLPQQLGTNLLTLWRHSPEHDANLRAADISQIGVAVAPGPDGCYASMDLGKPL
jgi:uncharacterized protein YkwD